MSGKQAQETLRALWAPVADMAVNLRRWELCAWALALGIGVWATGELWEARHLPNMGWMVGVWAGLLAAPLCAALWLHKILEPFDFVGGALGSPVGIKPTCTPAERLPLARVFVPRGDTPVYPRTKQALEAFLAAYDLRPPQHCTEGMCRREAIERVAAALAKGRGREPCAARPQRDCA